jgi:transcriptional regulator with XRE-family HTH domain
MTPGFEEEEMDHGEIRPGVARRQLYRRLRELRDLRRLKQREVASKLRWSLSKVMRIEKGKVPISNDDLRALLDLYGMQDAAEVERLTQLAEQSREPTVASQFADVLPSQLADWMDHEASASAVRQYETKLIPGVLQTPDYAAAIIRTYRAADSSPREIERLAEARVLRAKYVTGASGPEMEFIIDEAALRRGVGNESGPTDYSTMIDQLEQLKRLNTVGRRDRGEEIEETVNPEIRIQIVPFDMGAYELIRGPFELLEMDEDTLVYLEDPLRDEVLSEFVQDTEPYAVAFSRLQDRLAAPDQTNDLIDQVIQSMKEGTNSLTVRPSRAERS